MDNYKGIIVSDGYVSYHTLGKANEFCVGKHSWLIIDSKNGARASVMYYSIAEAAKANDLNPFEYFKYLMDQLKEHPRNDVPKMKLFELMPWSESIPDCCKQLKKDN